MTTSSALPPPPTRRTSPRCSRSTATWLFPLWDNEKRLVGIVTIDDAISIMQDEASEDIAKMNAIGPSDKPLL